MPFKLSDLQQDQHLNGQQWDELYEQIKSTHLIYAHPNVELMVTNVKIWPVFKTPIGIKDGELVYGPRGEETKFSVPLS